MTNAEMEAALSGDRKALKVLVQTLLGPIRSEVRVALWTRTRASRRDPSQEIDDFVQDVLLYVLENRGHRLRCWNPTRGRSLVSFVRLLARQRVSQILTGFRGNPWKDDPTEIEQTEALLGVDEFARYMENREELRGILDELLARFSSRDLELFFGIYVEQRPPGEVAAEFGMTRNAIDTWNSRMRSLARRLAARVPSKRSA